jgi:DNA polymerase-3 subunit epsilon
MSRQVVLDTETTGLDHASGHRIIEIACVEMVNRRLTRNNFYKRVHPERDIDPGATAVHGISIEDLEHEPKFAEIADEFLRYVAGAELIIHNAPFDIGFLNAELKRMKRSPLTEICAVTDTLAMARDLHPGKRNNLDALCDRYQIDHSARTVHGALLDAELLSDVYIAMTRGQDSLAIGLESGNGAANANPAIVARPATLKVRIADEEELRHHALQVATLNEASGGRAVWEIKGGDTGSQA